MVVWPEMPLPLGKLRILVTNDDGVTAPGLLALKRSLEALGDVFVVAPERPRSAVGHAVTLHKPLRLTEVMLEDGSHAWCCSGTPTDCVSIAYDVVMEQRVDLAFAGINDGANLGWDITYSGTVMGALEAAMLGIPTAAISVAGGEGGATHFDAAAAFARDVAVKIVENGLPPCTLVNVNVPDLPAEQLAGVAITTQGRREYVDRIVVRKDPRGQKYYWLSGVLKDDEQNERTDVAAVRRGCISVTPIGIDMTARELLPVLEAWWPESV